MSLKAELDWKYEPLSLKGKGVIISGGTTGIGRAAAVLLAAEGAKVFIFGRHEQELNDALEDIEAVGGQGYGITADQSREEDVQRVFEEADSKLGQLDILVNNAAIAEISTMENEFKDWNYLLDSNFLGYVACTRQALDRMKGRGQGDVVFVGSMSAKVREPGGGGLYAATKAAIQAYAESIRKEFNEEGIRVSLIEPGAVGTELGGQQDPKEQEEKIEQLKMLAAEDIAEAIRYCLVQPQRCAIVSMQVRPLKQLI